MTEKLEAELFVGETVSLNMWGFEDRDTGKLVANTPQVSKVQYDYSHDELIFGHIF